MLKSVRCSVLLLALFGLLSGCVAGLPIGGGAESDRPSAEQPATTAARRSAKLHVELGQAYLQSGRNGVALDEARAAIASDSAYAPGYLLQGMVYAAQEQYAQAIPGFEQASRLAPGDPEIANAYGWFLCSQGRESEGLPRIEQAARNPYYTTPTRAWTNAGLCLLRQKNTPAAEERFLRAVQADTTNLQAYYYLADIAYRSNRDLRAKEWMDQILKQMKNSNVEILWLAVRIENRLGNRSTVADLGSRMRKEFPGSNEYQYFLQGKFE
ncbi:type IV pilus biogenesis/stability protein PilW [Uliginosibacterium aquaticum]|uniref:Type IV pilus biogenesis/stability protein PilW n=1 Tax=Uliginosibacterium aquaticum TaxID=2731212 RepID=A0ABX2ICJ4_9RHOO|nr:type IV pilus biogenesis/stability protein PilW [Uliginosibacterium aquaticum]NSL54002.1 type IV pilus biogenesis/stability protein PilW [Uliginosibacterium aquaticum]